MKKAIRMTVAVGALLMLVGLCLGCSEEHKKQQSTGLSGDFPDTLEDMITESGTIVAVNLTGKETVSEVRDSGNYIKTKLPEAEVTEVIRGDPELAGQMINVLPLNISAYPEHRYLLFMNRSQELIGEHPVYVINGGGHLKIDEQGLLFWTKAEPLYPNSKPFYMDEAFTGLTIDEAQEKINGILQEKS
ncbi:hypothetical protein [Paenibacillus daejeonensis]|uniref:hypothetical protein n=1 Tax=Paenibacillus daejeonensis TaxID=135193 RepID=UPI000380E5B5|nr:hypothetical protein [Paenibacillus daejeonensis]